MEVNTHGPRLGQPRGPDPIIGRARHLFADNNVGEEHEQVRNGPMRPSKAERGLRRGTDRGGNPPTRASNIGVWLTTNESVTGHVLSGGLPDGRVIFAIEGACQG